MTKHVLLLAFGIALTAAWASPVMARITLNKRTLNGVALLEGIGPNNDKPNGTVLRATRIRLPSGAEMTFR